MARVELVVPPLLRDQLVVRAPLDDAALLQYHDAVRVPDRGQAVRDHEGGAPGHQGVHALLYQRLRPGVDGGGGLIQNQHLGVQQHRPGNGQELLLALGNIQAVLIDDGIIAVGKAADVTVDVGGLGGGGDLLQGGIRTAIGDILKNGAAEKPGVLENHGVGQTQAFPGKALDVPSVHGDDAVLGIIKAHEKVDEGGLPRAGMADDGHGASAGSAEAQVADNGLAGEIAEADMLHGNVSAGFGKNLCARDIRRFRRLIDEAEDPFCGGEGRLELTDDVGRLVDGTGKLAGIKNEGGNCPQRQHILQKEDCSEDINKGKGQVINKVDARAGDAAIIIGIVIGIYRFGVALVKPLLHGFFLVIGLDGLLAGDDFLSVAVELSQLLRPPPEQGAHLTGTVTGEKDRRRNGEQEHRYQRRRDTNHHDKGTHHRDNAGADLKKVVGK